jgi:hypothetical protein
LIIDIKNSWSWETFPLFEKGMPTDYYYQLQGYMALTGATKGKIIYTLINMPIELATKEGWRAGYDMDDIEQHEAFIASVTYDDLPADLRVKEFDCERDDEVIEAIRSRVVECRNYIGGLGYVN